jgi:hypothetical protein
MPCPASDDKATDAAQSWGNDADNETAGKRKAALSLAAGASNVGNWAVNKAVHYNEWANFGKRDFEPVVAAFQGASCMLSLRNLRVLGPRYTAWKSRVSALRV